MKEMAGELVCLLVLLCRVGSCRQGCCLLIRVQSIAHTCTSKERGVPGDLLSVPRWLSYNGKVAHLCYQGTCQNLLQRHENRHLVHNYEL